MDVPRALVAAGTPEHLDEVRAALRTLPEHADLARPRPTHPWRFVDERPGVTTDVTAAHRAAQHFDAALDDVQQDGVTLDMLARVTSPDEVEAWARVADAPRHPIAAVDALHEPAWSTWLVHLQDQAGALAGAPGRWRTVVAPSVMDRDVSAIHAAAMAADSSGFFGRKGRRRAVLAQLSGALLVDPKSIELKTLSQLTGDLAAAYSQVATMRAMALQIPLPLVDGRWNPAVPQDAMRLRDDLDWIRWLGAAVAPDGSRHRDDLRAFYAASPRGAGGARMTSLAQSWRGVLQTLAFEAAGLGRWTGDAGFLVAWWNGRGERHVETSVSLERWLALVRRVEPLRRHGMDAAREAILDGRTQPDDAVIAFDRGIARASVDERQEATALGDFDVLAHDRTIQRFTSSTHALRSELPRAIPQDVLEMRRFNANSAAGQIGGLRRQLDRQRGGMSVRALMQNFGDLITQIMPCTLMSPESVARFFPARAGLFDVVIFDEASQIRVADAIGAIGRAKSVVVVGDSRQMPPTQFAEASASVEEDEEYSSENVLDEESILSECVQARVPSKWLSWHYRSQDESLIAFSNHHYYENRLSSFPAPLPSDPRRHPDGYGISLVMVNGTFERSGRGKALRTNRVEAEAIIDDVRRRFWASPGSSPSLGVITFNAQQRDLIENLLRDSGDDRILQALDETDGLFVKNLENVQGDERDCILFSVAFSANDKGVVPLNFGPLSKPGGERRLNVAVTRARRQVVLYASFAPEALRAEETTQRGTKHLKAYLEMAARGVEAVSDDGRRQATIDRHRDDLAAELRMAGFAVRTDIGLSDFRVDISIADGSDPEKPLVAVLLDGPTWRARRTVADRDGLPVDVLKGLMRWPGVERVWLPEWMRSRAETLAQLTRAVDEARRAGEVPPAVVAPDPTPPSSEEKGRHAHEGDGFTAMRSAPDHSWSNPAEKRRHPLVTDYREWTPSSLGDVSVLDDLPRGWAATRVRAAVREAIEAEGPIHPDRLARLVAGAFGLRRVAEDRKTAIKAVVPSEYKPRGGDGFYWPTSLDPSTWAYVRRPDLGESRPLDEVPRIEIANAMRIVAEETGGVTADELKRGALQILGGRRITDAVGMRLDAGLKVAIDRGHVEPTPGGIYRPGTR